MKKKSVISHYFMEWIALLYLKKHLTKKKKALLLVADLQTSGLLFPFFYSFTPVFPRVALFLFILSCSCTCLL